MFREHDSPSDGLARVSYATGGAITTVPGVAIAEDARRITTVHVTASIAGQNVTIDAGPVIFHSSDPLLGEQNRPIGGVPAVTLTFDRGLEWMIANKPLDHVMRLSIRSYASSPRTFSFKVVAPPGVRVDSLPSSMTLQAKEEKELFVRVRGQLKADRYEFGIVAVTENGNYMDGFKAIEYSHIRPIRTYRYSALYLQAIEITIPATLSVAYIPGVGDNVAPFLRQLGIPVTIVNPEELPVVDLNRFSTVVVGTRAYEAHRELVAYNARLLDFAKKGGTLVVQYGQDLATLGVMPFQSLPAPRTSRGAVGEVPVTILERNRNTRVAQLAEQDRRRRLGGLAAGTRPVHADGDRLALLDAARDARPWRSRQQRRAARVAARERDLHLHVALPLPADPGRRAGRCAPVREPAQRRARSRARGSEEGRAVSTGFRRILIRVMAAEFLVFALLALLQARYSR